jgi:beta-glucanase (GH16 family)
MSERWKIEDDFAWVDDQDHSKGVARRRSPNQLTLNNTTGDLIITSSRETNTAKTHNNGWAIQREPMMFEGAPYGRYDTYAQTTAVTGLNAAVWLLGSESRENQRIIKMGEEIDILEGAGTQSAVECKNFNSNAVFTYTGAKSGEPNEAFGNAGYDFDLAGNSAGIGNDYHLFSFEWEPDEMRWLYDGYVMFRVPSIQLQQTGSYYNSGRPYDVSQLITKSYISWIVNTNTDSGYAEGTTSTLKIKYLKVSKKD